MNHCRCLLLIICCQILVLTAHSQLQKIYIHPKAAGNEKQSKFVDSIRFIPLQATPGVSLEQYNSVEPTRNYFLIRNFLGKEVLLYGKDGHFIKRIGYKKLGNEFYPLYDERQNQIVFFGANKNYTLTPSDKIKIQLDWNSPRNRKYYQKYTIDLNDSALVLKKELPEQRDIVRASHLYDALYASGKINTNDLYKDSLDYELKLYTGNEFVKGLFPYNRVNEVKYLYDEEENVSINKTEAPYVHLVTRPYCDTIYKMEKDNIAPYYQIVMPLENSLPPTFFEKPFKNKTERDNFKRNNGWKLSQIYSVYETPRFIYLQVGYMSNYEAYIYQKQTQTTHKVKNIKPDSSQYNLTLLSDYNVVRKQDRFYKTTKASELLKYFEKNPNTSIPPALESFLKNKPAPTDLVIIEFKFKN